MFLDDHGRTSRAKKILKKLMELSPDIMMFQEMTSREFQLFKSLLTGYKHSAPLSQRYWTCIFVRDTIEGTFDYIPYKETNMTRGISIFSTSDTIGPQGTINQDEMIYVSTHLESRQSEESIEARRKQIKQLQKVVEPFSKFVIGMDSNTKVPIYLGMDVWENEPIPTWHGDRYYDIPFSLRYDRFLVSGITVKDKKIDPMEEQSDHDALIITI